MSTYPAAKPLNKNQLPQQFRLHCRRDDLLPSYGSSHHQKFDRWFLPLWYALNKCLTSMR